MSWVELMNSKHVSQSWFSSIVKLPLRWRSWTSMSAKPKRDFQGEYLTPKSDTKVTAKGIPQTNVCSTHLHRTDWKRRREKGQISWYWIRFVPPDLYQICKSEGESLTWGNRPSCFGHWLTPFSKAVNICSPKKEHHLLFVYIFKIRNSGSQKSS